MKNENQLRVFISDDNVFTLNLYVKYFQDIGVTDITPFKNRYECLNNLCFNPDILFLDHTKDLLSDLALFKKIKITHPDIYLVIISGQENVGANHELLQHDGTFNYIAKYGYEELKIKNIIKRIALEKKNKNAWPGFLNNIFRSRNQNMCVRMPK